MKGTEMVMRSVKNNDLYMLEGSSVPVLAVMLAVSKVDRTKSLHLDLDI